MCSQQKHTASGGVCAVWVVWVVGHQHQRVEEVVEVVVVFHQLVAGKMAGVDGAVLAQELLGVVLGEPEAGAMVDVVLEEVPAAA